MKKVNLEFQFVPPLITSTFLKYFLNISLRVMLQFHLRVSTKLKSLLERNVKSISMLTKLDQEP